MLERGGYDEGMKVVVSGASGFIGTALVATLEGQGCTVVRLVRRVTAGDGEITWDPAAGRLEAADLAGADAVVHLAGESVAEGRWTPKKKSRIRESRVKGTRLLASALASLDPAPGVFVCASGIGFYGDRGEDWVDEDSDIGSGFLSEVCRDWEVACKPAADKGVRTVHARIGVVLGREGGALAKMLLPFKLGLGGVLGPGTQSMSWITLDDAASALSHCIRSLALSGPVNIVGPQPVDNREFTKTLGRVLGRPAIFTIPAFAARLAFGEMADALLLASTRVRPSRLMESGFEFQHPDLDSALRYLLG